MIFVSIKTKLSQLNLKRFLGWFIGLIFLATLILGIATYTSIQTFPSSLDVAKSSVKKLQLLDRNAQPLTVTYQNDWNLHSIVALHDIPEVIQKIFVLSEDKRFFEHHGVDWQARFVAIGQNILALRVIRGASTISEQVVRLIHPRPRTFWSRWVEGFEALTLEQQFSKSEILEFYLNQVPYASNRRGVVQAARHYFDRDLSTLNSKEMLILAVLVRSPSRLDLRHGNKNIKPSLQKLAERAFAEGLISQQDYQQVLTEPLELKSPQLPIQATHFASYLMANSALSEWQDTQVKTTLDGSVQKMAQEVLDKRLADLTEKNVTNGALLIVDHRQHNQILAWVNGGKLSPQVAGSQIDAVLTPRQPGSTLKPFLYALALEKGWTAATLINDAPLIESVGTGLHSYRNYSRSYYGWLRLRDALGNSLNTPAVRTAQFVGAGNLLRKLRQLGMKSLDSQASFYGDGLALGNGAITLFELVQGYAALANQGHFYPLQSILNETPEKIEQQPAVFSEEISSIITDILADADARRLEFGRSGLLRFPVQTAVKTGTSTDYRDAWAVGFNHHYVVGVWLGNLDQHPMHEVSGSIGPALVLRTVFAELNRFDESRELPRSPQLQQVEICRDTGLPVALSSHPDKQPCASRPELFIAGTVPQTVANDAPTVSVPTSVYLKQPVDGLQLALDPRIPDAQEAFPLVLNDTAALRTWQGQIEWLIDGETVGKTSLAEPRFLWNVQQGTHLAQAKITLEQPKNIVDDTTHEIVEAQDKQLETPIVMFFVK